MQLVVGGGFRGWGFVLGRSEGGGTWEGAAAELPLWGAYTG